MAWLSLGGFPCLFFPQCSVRAQTLSTTDKIQPSDKPANHCNALSCPSSRVSNLLAFLESSLTSLNSHLMFQPLACSSLGALPDAPGRGGGPSHMSHNTLFPFASTYCSIRLTLFSCLKKDLRTLWGRIHDLSNLFTKLNI